MNENPYRTDFLVPRSDFVSGAARTLDLFSTFNDYDYSGSPAEADRRALANDWTNVAQDFCKVLLRKLK